MDVALSSTSEGLNGEDFTLLHLSLVSTLDNGHTLSTVDDVLVNVVSVQVTNTLDRVHSSIEFDLVTLHSLLNSGTDITHANVNTGLLYLELALDYTIYQNTRTYPNTSVGGILDGFKEGIVDRVKCHGEGTVNNATIEMSTEINLHDITLVENHLVSSIGSVMRGTVVNAETARETHATLDVIALLQT